jgi:hypothetical protein
MESLGWYSFEGGSTIGATGSENGIILRDEEYGACARITLERDGHTPFALTCGIYGWMVHTRFFATGEEANSAFKATQAELARIIDLIPSRDDPQPSERSSVAAEAMHDFVNEFP